MRWIERLFFGALIAATTGPALAWSQHALGAWQALHAMPEVRAEPPVKVEPLAKFLKDQGPALEGLLQHEEQWARGHVRNYPPRPEILAYRHDKEADATELRQRFLTALRVNPNIPLPLYLQLQPTPAALAENQRPAMAAQDISLVKDAALSQQKFVSLREGDVVSVIDVIASAVDEPDYGLDIGLWADNDTEFGRVYGFGKQPFGNPKLSFGSQAPFHMGFFHESPIIYAAAGFLRRTYPEYRMHLWQTLARHALLSGHPYWGWRFAGWAMHYAQDLTQPYHASVLPGTSVAGMLWINALDMAGASKAKHNAVTFVSNRHLVMENFHQHSLLAPLEKGEMEHPNLTAFAQIAKDKERMVLTEFGLRDAVTKHSHAVADEMDEWMVKTFPASYVSDPQFDVGAQGQGINFYSLMSQHNPTARDMLDKRLRELSGDFGSVTRAVWRRLR